MQPTLSIARRLLSLTMCAVLLLIACLLMMQPLHAAQYADDAVLNPTSISAGANSNYNTTITLTKYEDVTLTLRYLPPTGTSNVWFTFKQAANPTNAATVNKIVIGVPGATVGTQAIVVTNISMGAAGYLIFEGVTNTFQSAAITNCAVEVAKKPSRFGN